MVENPEWRKYEFTGENRTIIKNNIEIVLKRIRALRNLCPTQMDGEVHKGDIGGWIESEYNLSHLDMCWVDEEAMVFEQAVVKDNAYICGNARIEESAVVCDDACADENAIVAGKSTLANYATVYGNAQIRGLATVDGDIIIKGNTVLTSIAESDDCIKKDNEKNTISNIAKVTGFRAEIDSFTEDSSSITIDDEKSSSMENIDSIISKWDMLLDDLRQHSFGDGDVEKDLFKSAVKDSFYYFKEVVKPQENNSDCMLTIKESQLLSHIYAYSVQIICTLSEISEYCEATKLVAKMLYNAVVYTHQTLYMRTQNILYMTLINNKSGETFTGCYNIEKGDLGEAIELVRFKYAD